MKLTKEFSPVIMTLETEKDVLILISVLRNYLERFPYAENAKSWLAEVEKIKGEV